MSHASSSRPQTPAWRPQSTHAQDRHDSPYGTCLVLTQLGLPKAALACKPAKPLQWAGQSHALFPARIPGCSPPCSQPDVVALRPRSTDRAIFGTITLSLNERIRSVWNVQGSFVEITPRGPDQSLPSQTSHLNMSESRGLPGSRGAFFSRGISVSKFRVVSNINPTLLRPPPPLSSIAEAHGSEA